MYKLITNFNQLSLRKKFIFSGIVTMIAVLIVQISFYMRITQTTKYMVDEYANSIINQAVSGINSMMDGTQQVAYHFSYGTLIEKYMVPESSYDLYNMWGYQSDMVRTAVETNANIYDIAFLRTDGYIRYHFRNADLELRKLLDKYESILLSPDTKPGFVCLTDELTHNVRVPAYVQPIYHTSTPVNYGKVIGVCVVMLQPEILNSMLENISINDKSTFYLTDDNNTIVSGTCPDPDNMLDFLNRPSVISQPIGNTGWRLVCEIDTQSAIDNYNFFSSFAVVVAVLMLIFLFILLRIFNQSIVAPIYHLHQEIEAVITHRFRQRINMPYTDEVGGIAQAINTMIDEQAETSTQMLLTQQRLYEAQLETTSYELIALENQVNPHFLLNTLQCIAGIAIDHDNPIIANITVSLAGIFHYSLRGGEKVSIADEIRCVRQYLSIIDVRFDYIFRWDISIPEEYQRLSMPKMILQPLAENAIYHGLEKKGFGELRIFAERNSDTLMLTIEDTGVGVEEKKLKELQALLSDHEVMHLESLRHKRIGLANTCWRLNNMFGNNYGIQIDSRKGCGTRLVIHIPF